MSNKKGKNLLSDSIIVENLATLEYINKGVLDGLVEEKYELFKNYVDSNIKLQFNNDIKAFAAGEFIRKCRELENSKNIPPRLAVFQRTEEAIAQYNFERYPSIEEAEIKVNSKDYELVFVRDFHDKDSIPADKDILYFGSERTIKPSDYYSRRSFGAMDIVVIFDGKSLNARFYDGVGLTKFPAVLDKTMERKFFSAFDVRTEAELLKVIHNNELKFGDKILTDEYINRYNTIENHFDQIFKSADLRAENPVSYKSLDSFTSLLPGDLVFTKMSPASLNIEQLQDIQSTPDAVYVGRDPRTEKEITFTFDDIDIVHRNNTEFNRDEQAVKTKGLELLLNVDNEKSQVGREEQSHYNTMAQWKQAIKEAKGQALHKNEGKENIKNKDDINRFS
ncbi:MAG TPA: YodL domain-containing protein [Defluviitaleaceae bacterium]|nr:YodL domain-containing protein [Defluviitaleaceae bacterium]